MMFVGCCPFWQKDNGRLAVYSRSARIILLMDEASLWIGHELSSHSCVLHDILYNVCICQ